MDVRNCFQTSVTQSISTWCKTCKIKLTLTTTLFYHRHSRWHDGGASYEKVISILVSASIHIIVYCFPNFSLRLRILHLAFGLPSGHVFNVLVLCSVHSVLFPCIRDTNPHRSRFWQMFLVIFLTFAVAYVNVCVARSHTCSFANPRFQTVCPSSAFCT